MERLTPHHDRPLLLVTGAGGFLGRSLVQHLGGQGTYRVRATVRSTRHSDALNEANCEVHVGDLTDADFCARITSDVDTIIHCAALSRPYGPYEDFLSANVDATTTLMQAAKASGCRQWVNIGTPSIYTTGADRFDVAEKDVLPKKMINHYASTKYMAECYVLQQNSSEIRTLSLRPRAIIGAGDTVIMPRLLAAHASGRLRIIGSGQNVVDLTNVRNVIEAILCSLNAHDDAWGSAYNVTNGEPVLLWEMIRDVFTGLGMQPPSSSIPRAIVYGAAAVSEALHQMLKKPGEPTLTRYGVHVLASSMTLDIDQARTKLGYQPVQNTADGIREFCQWYTKENP